MFSDKNFVSKSSFKQQQPARVSYRILPRWLRNTTDCDSETQVEFGWVMFEILNNDITTATAICWLPDFILHSPINPLRISIADKADIIDVLKQQLPEAQL